MTYYVYDGNVVIEEQDEDNDETARNVYGRNLVTRETVDGLVVYAYNGHSDVVAICNIDGDILVTYTYDEFGNLIDETVTDETYTNFDNPYRYAGYEYLEQIGIYDLNARYYNPEIARFLSPDPYYNLGNRVIGLYEINVPSAASIIQANNIYAYCGNSPIKYVDPSGEAVLTLSVGGALLAKAAPYIIAGVAAIGTIMFAEHHKKGTTNPSNLPKHQKGQKRKQTDKYGGEKGDARRTPRKDKKK